jgi:beta-phosphoglucomutase-like phosphatase (HAD superfamily)
MPAFDPSAAASGALQPDLQAVFWDMDGTLVDTEPYWIEAESELVASFGGVWSDELGLKLVGNALETSAGVLQQAGVDLSIRDIIDRLIDTVTERVRQRIPWRPGARELLAELFEAGIPTVLVTMSESKLATEVVRALPEGSFQYLVTGDMVGQGKPHPEPYQRAFDWLSGRLPGADKRYVVALEDSVPGVASAEAAGLVTVAIPHVVPVPPAPGRPQWDSLAGKGVMDVERLLLPASQEAGV